MIKAIIFDLDGTLCDTLEDIRTGVNAALKRLGYNERTLEEIHSFINKQVIPLWFPLFNISQRNFLIVVCCKNKKG